MYDRPTLVMQHLWKRQHTGTTRSMKRFVVQVQLMPETLNFLTSRTRDQVSHLNYGWYEIFKSQTTNWLLLFQNSGSNFANQTRCQASTGPKVMQLSQDKINCSKQNLCLRIWTETIFSKIINLSWVKKMSWDSFMTSGSVFSLYCTVKIFDQTIQHLVTYSTAHVCCTRISAVQSDIMTCVV